jgi:uncharacterized protein with beta-barrel porin domain
VGCGLWRIADTDGNTALGSNTTTSRIGGVAVGVDYRFSPYTLAGFALAGGGTSARPVSPARWPMAGRTSTDRTVTIAGTDLLRARFNANAFSGRVEGGYRFVTPWMAMGITPYAAGQFTTFDLPAYAERRRQYVRASLRREERHGVAQRTRRSHRQILSDAGWHLHPARPRRLGARF